jgi:hypothetical protein
MTIDERLEAITQSLEVLTHDVHSAQERTKRLEDRDRRLREALMAGVAAYLQVLAEDDDDAEAEA